MKPLSAMGRSELVAEIERLQDVIAKAGLSPTPDRPPVLPAAGAPALPMPAHMFVEPPALPTLLFVDGVRVNGRTEVLGGQVLSYGFEPAAPAAGAAPAVVLLTDGHLGSWCPQCGPDSPVDGDGCCTTCGCTAVGDGVDAIFRMRADLVATRELCADQHARNARAWWTLLGPEGQVGAPEVTDKLAERRMGELRDAHDDLARHCDVNSRTWWLLLGPEGQIDRSPEGSHATDAIVRMAEKRMADLAEAQRQVAAWQTEESLRRVEREAARLVARHASEAAAVLLDAARPLLEYGSPFVIEDHGDGEAMYFGRDGARHGLNMIHLTDPSYQWPVVRAALAGLVNAALDALEHKPHHHHFELRADGTRASCACGLQYDPPLMPLENLAPLVADRTAREPITSAARPLSVQERARPGCVCKWQALDVCPVHQREAAR